MTTTTISVPETPVAAFPPGPQRLRWAMSDMLTVTKRNLLGYVRVPSQIFFASVQPVMFVLLFRYVFGGAIPTPGYHYVQFLLPGIFVQAVAFGAIGTSIGLAEDLQKGLIERFRALPMSRWAVLAGRTTADLCRNIFVMVLMTAVGYAVGFRIATNVGEYLLGVLLLLFFAYALSWGFAFIGLSAPNSETAELMSFPLLFPLTFASSAFVPLQSMPGWLQAFAQHQPVTIVVNAARDLMSGTPKASLVLAPFKTATNTGSVDSTVFWAAVWSLGILAVLAPVAVRRYKRRAV
jgi:ABC-2 type transport system permease protein/oleandomycin transport system permease protein